MPTVRILTPPAGSDRPAGSEVKVSPEEARQLIAYGEAELVREERLERAVQRETRTD